MKLLALCFIVAGVAYLYYTIRAFTIGYLWPTLSDRHWYHDLVGLLWPIVWAVILAYSIISTTVTALVLLMVFIAKAAVWLLDQLDHGGIWLGQRAHGQARQRRHLSPEMEEGLADIQPPSQQGPAIRPKPRG